jgi:hypothetical protein
VIAHRFGNRLDALRDAERLGVPCVEADLRLFRGRVEVRHLKSVGALPLFWDRWRVAAPWSPRLALAELLFATGPQTELVLDLKGRDTALGRLVAKAIEPHLPARRFIVCARSTSQLEPFGELPVRRFESETPVSSDGCSVAAPLRTACRSTRGCSTTASSSSCGG